MTRSACVTLRLVLVELCEVGLVSSAGGMGQG